MWMVFTGGTWQPAASDAVVIEWIRGGMIAADTMIRHASWPQAVRVAEVPNFQAAFGRAASGGGGLTGVPARDYAALIGIGGAVLFVEFLVYCGIVIVAARSLAVSVAISITAAGCGFVLLGGRYLPGAPAPLRSFSGVALKRPLVAGSILLTFVLGGATAAYAHQRTAGLCNQAVADVANLKNESLPFDVAMRRLDELEELADTGVSRCEAAGNPRAADGLRQAKAAIRTQRDEAKRQAEVQRTKAAEDERRKYVEAEKLRKEKASQDFPNQVKAIGESISHGQSAMAKGDYSGARIHLATARGYLNDVKGTAAENSSDWGKLNSRLSSVEKALQPHLDRLAAQEEKAERSANEQAALRGAKPEPSAWDGSFYPVEKYLKANLKDPDSYEHVESIGPTADGQYWRVRSKYRAKNSFGALVLESRVFFIQQGQVVKVEE